METVRVEHLKDTQVQNRTLNSRVSGKVYDDEQFTQELDQEIELFNEANGTHYDRFSFPKNMLLTFLDLLSSEGITAPFVLVWPLDNQEGHPELVAVYKPGERIKKRPVIAGNHPHPAFDVWKKLTISLLEVIQGKRDIETVFNDIPIRDCLPQHTVLATTWHIDDLRDIFPFGTPDEELYQTLLELERSFRNVAVSSGNEVIENLAYINDVEVDNEVVILDAWAKKDPETGYGDIFIDEKIASDAMEKYGKENILKGFVIIGGSSISPYIEENFQGFYEHMRELMTDILKHQGIEHHLTSEKEATSIEVEVGHGIIVVGETVYSIRHCSGCNKDFVLESNDDPSKDGPRERDFDDTCDDCLSQGIVTETEYMKPISGTGIKLPHIKKEITDVLSDNNCEITPEMNLSYEDIIYTRGVLSSIQEAKFYVDQAIENLILLKGDQGVMLGDEISNIHNNLERIEMKLIATYPQISEET